MSFPRYPQYKPSGVQWLGDVPEHWARSALKRLAKYENGYPYKPDDRGEAGLPIIRISQLTSNDPPAFFEGDAEQHVAITDGDLLFAWSASIDAYIWRGGAALLNQHIFKVMPGPTVDKNYLFHLIRHVAPKLAEFDAHGSTMRHIKKESLGEVTYMPPLPEQRAIAAFLDRETEKIDALVAEQQRLIELLKEKRQAVISHAVTKGLDPKAPMKPSGVEWLGNVPAHWEVKRLKHVVAVPITDGPHETPEFLEEGVPFISAEAVSGGFIDFTKARGCISVDDNVRFSEKYAPVLGDIYMVKSGATTGVTALVTDRVDFNIWSPLAAIRCGESLLPRYLLNFLRSRPFQEAVALGWSFGTQQNIGMGVLGNLHCVVPPRKEQERIVEYVNIAGFDELVVKAESAIALFQERRSALISAAVTGQIDVRNAVATEAA